MPNAVFNNNMRGGDLAQLGVVISKWFSIKYCMFDMTAALRFEALGGFRVIKRTCQRRALPGRRAHIQW